MLPTPSYVSLPQRLRAETRSQHDALEAGTRSQRLLAADLTPTEYAQYLRALWQFHTWVEHTCFPLLAGHLPDIALRTKTPWLRADLLALGIPEAALLGTDATSAPRCDQPDAAWGGMYVAEGSTLGGQVLVKALARGGNWNAEHGGRFFYGYGDQTGVRWKTFLAAMQDSAQAEAIVVDSANATFAWVHRLMDGR